MSSLPASDVPSARARRRALAWPIGLSLILGCTVAANLYVMRIAAGDPSFAVEPDYYQKAVHWDDELAQRERNAALGWQVASSAQDAARDSVRLAVHLTDAAGAPLDGATVTVEAIPVARAAQRVHATLAAAGDAGAYAARVPVPHGGRWELRLEATRDGERFTAVQRVDVERATVPRVDVIR